MDIWLNNISEMFGITINHHQSRDWWTLMPMNGLFEGSPVLSFFDYDVCHLISFEFHFHKAFVLFNVRNILQQF